MNNPDHSNPFADPDSDRPTEATSSDGVVNPYASPREAIGPANVDPEIGLWQDGTLLVVHRDAKFPPFCVRTNESSQRDSRCDLLWSYPIDFSSRRVSFNVGLCEWCLRRHRNIRRWGLGLIVAGVFMMLPASSGYPHFMFAALALFVVGLFFVSRPAVHLKVKRAKPPYFWIQGVHYGFVERLPRWIDR